MGILTFRRTSQAGKWDAFESRSGRLALKGSQRFVLLLFSEINPQVASAFIRVLNFDRREGKLGKRGGGIYRSAADTTGRREAFLGPQRLT